MSGTLRFLLASWKVNLASALEYRLSFFLLAGMMFVNNTIWLFFWYLFFARFPVVSGWEIGDVMLLWAVSAGGFGWASVLFGNFPRIATIVSSGQLDVYLSQPKPVLLNMLTSRMSVTGAGDFAFGLIVFLWAGDLTPRGCLLFACALLLAGVLFIGVMAIAGSLAFWIGNAEGIASQVFGGFISLTIYPTGIFRGAAKVILFTVVPAGFIGYMPIGLMREFDPGFAAAAFCAAAIFSACGALLFRVGLARYASGNAMTMRN
ncbi:ABC-2 type transport system permease protein [Cohnella sp. OV330]|uniref:ABC transporter permease n=1 Tax=Cohnella sp. OV330 TaxID=1855288 RepID=UPI0008EB9ED7|nr:ABC-2 family transporter protein [Cohnella sp. OV330]SFB36253.1 ABC-2 type transport system permease protein [Cohnella sp. OV330]